MGFSTIIVNKDIVALITLNRPKLRNAFNELLIQELTYAAKELSEDPIVRVIVLTGSDNSFCAGADINWMQKMVSYSADENKEDSFKMAEMFQSIAGSPKPWIAKVNGHAIGGGAGLVAACDLAVGIDNTKFGFTEVRLGILPAVISPYVIQKIGINNARRYFLTGEVFDSKKALSIGLLDEAANDSTELEEKVNQLAKSLLQGSPNAMTGIKKLISVVPGLSSGEAIHYTAELIANQRVSAEGQEGLRAFLNKQTPSWISSIPQKWL